jgi:CHAD domain-containing protein
MKARKVAGLDPTTPLAENGERIVRVRLDELVGFMPAAATDTQALHDMRIAAKRLRYVLELTAETCFGAYAATGAKRARELQDLLGEIHDCDVLIARVGDRAELRFVAARLGARRAELFESFVEVWRSLERDGFAARLEYALQERPATAVASETVQ